MEERYPEFPGLNLSFEVREAFVKHSGRIDAPECAEFRDCGGPLLEAQVVDVVDSIAYDTHDTDDALGLGFITLDELKRVEFWERAAERVPRSHAGAVRESVPHGRGARTAEWQVTDLLEETVRGGSKLRTSARWRTFVRRPSSLVGFSPEVPKIESRAGTVSARARVYCHHRVLRMTANGNRILQALFAEYVRSPQLLPEKHLRRWTGADAIAGPPPAGMADRQPPSRSPASSASSAIISPA